LPHVVEQIHTFLGRRSYETGHVGAVQ
jgi:hypothetical protein